jgi:hypothetical protein
MGLDSGFVGIGTSSPFSMLSVAGQVVAQNYISTSTTATSSVANAFQIGTTAGDNALKVQASRVYPASVSTGGLVNLSNGTVNSGPALVAYSNFGAGATGRLVSVLCDNAAFDQDCAIVDNDGANTTALNVKGEPTGKGVVKIEHTGVGTGFSNSSLLSLDGIAATDAQGLFVDFSSGPTTGKLLNIRNAGVEYMTLLGAGNLGVGTSSPYSKLSVAGQIVANNILATSTTATSTVTNAF